MKGLFNGCLIHLALLFPLKHQLGTDMPLKKGNSEFLKQPTGLGGGFNQPERKNTFAKLDRLFLKVFS